MTLNFGKQRLRLIALVVDSANADILAGIPFCKRNSVEVSIRNDEIYINDEVIKYGQGPHPVNPRIFKADAILLRSNSTSVIHHGEFLQVHCPDLMNYDGDIFLLNADFELISITR